MVSSDLQTRTSQKDKIVTEAAKDKSEQEMTNYKTVVINYNFFFF